jgi:hypothetical protein
MIDPVPFDENRICIRGVLAGIPGVDGKTLSHCETRCSEFEKCRYEAAAYDDDYRFLKIGKKIVKLEKKLAKLEKKLAERQPRGARP